MNPRNELTRNQSLVLKALADADAPLGAYAVLDRLRAEGFRAPLQVYRALERLQELDLVHRLESLNAFVACAHPHEHEHETVGFAICDNCGRVDEFADEDVENRLSAMVGARGFQPAKTTIEIRGLCAVCAEV